MSTYLKESTEKAMTTTSSKQVKGTPLTRQTGQVLVAFGTLFKHIPPFNETIDENTGNTLISIGKKLLASD